MIEFKQARQVMKYGQSIINNKPTYAAIDLFSLEKAIDNCDNGFHQLKLIDIQRQLNIVRTSKNYITDEHLNFLKHYKVEYKK